MTDWFNEWEGAWHNEWHQFPSSAVIPPYAPDGVATLVLDIEQGFKIRHRWYTDVIKFGAGAEQRISRNDSPQLAFSGSVFLSTAQARTIRSLFKRYAAQGAIFLLALPHEGLSCVVNGTVVSVNPAYAADWTKPGQRVTGVDRSTGVPVGTDGVIQSVVNGAITLDVSVAAGSEILPLIPVYLEPQQNVPRHRTAVEHWQLTCRAVVLDYAPTLATLELDSITSSAAFDDARFVSRLFGLQGNQISVTMTADGSGTGSLSESGTAIQIHYEDGVTTLGDLATLLESSSLILLGGTYTDSDTIATADAFALQSLSGASAAGDVGTGATITEYAGHPVWTEKIANAGENVDGVHALTQIIDHGGAPYSLGTADEPDWFRAVVIEGGDRDAFQWFRLFMATVFGRQKKFWLPTWREDLEYVSHGGTSLVVDADAGDFTAWWPDTQYLQIRQTDGTITYVGIASALDNGDGTRTLTLDTALSAVDVDMISWLELCRFEDADEYTTEHSAEGFSVQMTARVVQ